MPFDGPGLEYNPGDDKIMRFGSLMPEPEPKRGIVSKVLGVPIAIIKLPFRIVGGVLKAPFKLFSRSGDDDTE